MKSSLARSGLLVALTALSSVAFAAPQHAGHLLVSSYGTLLLISPDGTQHPLAGDTNQALLSPDGSKVAFTTSSDPKNPASTQLMVITPEEGGKTEIAELPKGSAFGHIAWEPDGNALAYDAVVHGKSDDLFIAPISGNAADGRSPAPGMALAPKSARNNLGHWYQGISFSPDGKQIVHAVNNGPDESGLEVLDRATQKRTLLYKTESIVWDARYSPDGKYIAYTMTIREPDRGDGDDVADCTPPTIGLWLYSIEQKSAKQVTVPKAPGDDMKNFAWSPDGKHIALTLGSTDCDYPGSTAAVFLTDVGQTHQVRLSSGDMAFEPAFSPDGTGVAFVDFSQSPAKLMRYTISTGKLDLIRQAPEESNYYTLLDWK